jgi:hypothetical protein
MDCTSLFEHGTPEEAITAWNRRNPARSEQYALSLELVSLRVLLADVSAYLRGTSPLVTRIDAALSGSSGK